ncbi:CPBP family intramembrane metalloprotease, partial [Candidatus Peregrinibacteria bacterium CG22_combo_CG10-13_8_21_14_all_44_10]
AFIASAAVFAGIHLEFQVFMPLFLLGLVLNWMFYKSGSLYPGIFFHIV